MPDNVVCTFDSMCLGIECCVNIKLAVYLSTINVFARFDVEDVKFVYGVNDFIQEIQLGSSHDGNRIY